MHRVENIIIASTIEALPSWRTPLLFFFRGVFKHGCGAAVVIKEMHWNRSIIVLITVERRCEFTFGMMIIPP